MIRRDRNHPSIILWNACINHHGYHPGLVEAATQEDPTRFRGQDTVRTPMDFRHRKVSGQGALSLEHTGHTYPATRGAKTTTKFERLTYYPEISLAFRHAEHTDAILAKHDNAGAAAWAMYDYNTLRHTDEPGIAWHGFADIFRLPKLSFYWHQSEFVERPIIHVFAPIDQEVVVFSNAEKVQLWSEGNGDSKLVAEQATPKTITIGETNVPAALRHPPFRFKLSHSPLKLRAVGIWNDHKKEVAWQKPGHPRKIQIAADSPELGAGAMTRLVAAVTDESGSPLDDFSGEAVFSVRGSGELIGENPAKIRAGYAVILFRGKYGDSTVTAATKELSSGTIQIKARK